MTHTQPQRHLSQCQRSWVANGKTSAWLAAAAAAALAPAPAPATALAQSQATNQPSESGENPQPTAARHLHCIWHLHSTPFSLTSRLPPYHSFTFSSRPQKTELRVSFIRSALASSSSVWAKDVARAKVSATHSWRVHHLLWHCCGSPGSGRSFECIHECRHTLAAQRQTHNLHKLSC